MPSVQSMAQDNRILRNRLKAGLDNRKITPQEMALWPLIYLAAKLLRHEEALETLAERGFGTEAGMILRTMFEAAVTIMWIVKSEDPQGTDIMAKLKRYHDYQFVSSEKFRISDSGREAINALPDAIREEWEKTEKILSQKAQEAKDEYGFNPYRPWSGKSLKEMAKEVGWGERYETLYQIYSEVIHSGVLAVQEYLVFDKDGKVTVNYRQQTEHSKMCLYEGQVYILTAFSFLNVLLDLGLDKVIESGMESKPHSTIGKNIEINWGRIQNHE